MYVMGVTLRIKYDPIITNPNQAIPEYKTFPYKVNSISYGWLESHISWYNW